MRARELAAAQAWLQAAVLGEDAADAAEHLTPSLRLSAQERLELYRGMIALRFEECLREDYPATCAALGPTAWGALAAEYPRAHPSGHFSLNRLGAHLPAFVRGREAGGRGAFLAELAELELALQQVFDAPEHPVAGAKELAAVPPQAWADVRLRTIPALRLLALEFDVEAWYLQWREKGATALPGRAHGSGSGAALPAFWLAVYRSHDRVWRAPLCREQHALLSALAGGAPLADALEAAAALEAHSRARVAAGVRAWFEQWAAQGLFLPLEARPHEG